MKQEVFYFGDIAIRMRRVPRARHLRLSVDGGGSILLTRPIWMSKASALSFLKEKEAWLRERLSEIRSKPLSMLHRGGREEYLLHKERARQFILRRIELYNRHYCFRFSRVSIRDQKSRWGSCSKTGGLNFNYRLVFLPSDLADYIIVHELCHLKEMNHGKNFWKLVSETVPDHVAKRSRLRTL